MPYVAPTLRNAGEAILASDQNIWVNNQIDLRSYQNRYAEYRYTAGNLTLTGTTNWSTLTTVGTAADLTLNASAGDVIEAGVFAAIDTAAVILMFDWVTVVGTTVTNSFTLNGAAPTSTAQLSTSGFQCPSGVFWSINGSQHYTLGAGDVSAGTVKLRLRYVMGSAVNRGVYSDSTRPFIVWARNFGPVTT